VCGPLKRTCGRGGRSEHTLGTLGVEAAAHPLVLAEAVGMAPDVAWAQRAEIAEVRASVAGQNPSHSVSGNHAAEGTSNERAGVASASAGARWWH
jgi:hypothetical protein